VETKWTGGATLKEKMSSVGGGSKKGGTKKWDSRWGGEALVGYESGGGGGTSGQLKRVRKKHGRRESLVPEWRGGGDIWGGLGGRW